MTSTCSWFRRHSGCPLLAFFARVGRDAADSITFVIPRGLHRYYGADHLHFIKRYRFVVVGYVVMPEHIHLLLNADRARDRNAFDGDAGVEAAHGPCLVAEK